MIMPEIVSITLLIAASAAAPYIIATVKVSLNFGALEERFHEVRIWLPNLKTPGEGHIAVRELRRQRRGT